MGKSIKLVLLCLVATPLIGGLSYAPTVSVDRSHITLADKLIVEQAYAAVRVKGYYRKDGTYVRPHYRSNPDGNPYNNYSFPGNVNPYTGKVATGNPATYLKNYYGSSTSVSSGIGSQVTDSSSTYPSTSTFQSFPSPLRYQWIAQSGTIEDGLHTVHASAGDTIAMSLTLRNRAIDPRALVIYGKSAVLPENPPYVGAHEVRLGIDRPRDYIHNWIDPSSFIVNPNGGSNRLAIYDGAPVGPNRDFTMNFNIKIKDNTVPGTYWLYTSLVREFDAWGQQVDPSGKSIDPDICWKVVIG